jgi:O-antigen ligase
MLVKKKLNKIIYLLLCTAIIIFPYNIDLFFSFRPLDIVLIISCVMFILSNPLIDKKILFLFLSFFFIILFSNIFGIILHKELDIKKIIFLYKYLLIFLVPWMFVITIKKNEQIRYFNIFLLINLIGLSAWICIYAILVKYNLIQGSFRPSFPAFNYHQTDAHLLSSYLGFAFLFYVLYLRVFFKHNIYLSVSIILLSVLGILLTGSRTGTLAIILYFFYLIFNEISFEKKNLVKLKKKYLKFLFFLLIILFFIYLIIYNNNSYSYNDNLRSSTFETLQRSIDINFHDLSASSRIAQLKIAIIDNHYFTYLFGLGLYNKKIWYDGLFSQIISQGGVLSFFIFLNLIFFIIYKFIKSNKFNSNYNLIFIILLFYYIISNLITEFIFVSRNAFPVLIMFSVLFLSSKNNIRLR